jgi:hypothetical protein
MTNLCENCRHLINESRMGTLNQNSDVLLTAACMKGHNITKQLNTNKVIYRGANCMDYHQK